MDQEALERILNAALDTRYVGDDAIIKVDIAERTLCARLAAIVQGSFTGHAVHAEYNRRGVYPKEIDLPYGDGVLTVTRVFARSSLVQLAHVAPAVETTFGGKVFVNRYVRSEKLASR